MKLKSVPVPSPGLGERDNNKGAPRKIVAQSRTIARSALRSLKDLIDKRAFHPRVPIILGLMVGKGEIGHFERPRNFERFHFKRRGQTWLCLLSPGIFVNAGAVG